MVYAREHGRVTVVDDTGKPRLVLSGGNGGTLDPEYARGFQEARRQALWWAREIVKADGNKDWQEACAAVAEAILSKVAPCATEEG